MLLMGKSTISIAIFNSYVKLPEGKARGEILSQKKGDSSSTKRYKKWISP